jgi:hypothetical protein
MKQVKTIRANYRDDFDREMNQFLASISDNEPQISFSPKNIAGNFIGYVTYRKAREDII